LSNDLEAIVRPSQTLDYAPAKMYYMPGQSGVPNTLLQFGRGGQGKTFSGSGSASSSSYMTQYVNEKKHAT
jgi:hypothetical protein